MELILNRFAILTKNCPKERCKFNDLYFFSMFITAFWLNTRLNLSVVLVSDIFNLSIGSSILWGPALGRNLNQGDSVPKLVVFLIMIWGRGESKDKAGIRRLPRRQNQNLSLYTSSLCRTWGPCVVSSNSCHQMLPYPFVLMLMLLSLWLQHPQITLGCIKTHSLLTVLLF